MPAARESRGRLDAIDGVNAKLARAITELAVSWLMPAERGMYTNRGTLKP